MRLPTQLLRRNPHAYKNQFGHVLILAGSKTMLGAAALTGLAAMRMGAGLVTIGIPENLNDVLQKKISSVIMTLPLKASRQGTISLAAYRQLKKILPKYQAIAIGPGLGMETGTQKFCVKMIETVYQPIVIDADALNCVARNLQCLKKTSSVKILTPHIGEMARLTNLPKSTIEQKKKEIACDFVKRYNCTILLKGRRTIVYSTDGQSYTNKSGNPGMATAGSGDVLTGMIAALLGQGLNGFEAAKWGAYLHGKAGDIAARNKGRISLIATDIIDRIPEAVKN